jgi:aconitate hydratase
MNAATKILLEHLQKGRLTPGEPIEISIDQTLTQDSTGTMAYLQLEALGVDKVKTKRSVAYIDHNMLQEGFENADDHLYIQSIAAKHGIFFSRPGNGICHQTHLERFGVPGQTLLGSDSHTPTCGALGMIAIGAGGLDVACAMGGAPYALTCPQIIKVNLTNRLNYGVSAKDVILEILRRLTVKGGVGKIFEYAGDGLKTLSVPERATIANMGAELGATTSVFPSDEITRAFLKAQNRESDFTEIKADEDAEYDGEIEIDLAKIVPLAAAPHSPDNVIEIEKLVGKKINQVAIGSCTNGSLADMTAVAAILKGKTVAPDVSLVISPGSRQVLTMMAQNGALADMLAAGARILEPGCGPCIGMGQAPNSGGVSVRTFNRNFKGRSGTADAEVYLTSPQTAAACALAGELALPAATGSESPAPESFFINDNMIIAPPSDSSNVEIIRGPNIKPFPVGAPLRGVEARVVLKVGDNITTDHIMPSNAKLLPFRSNIPYLANFCLTPCDPEFPKRIKKYGSGIIVAGENYGQGSSREHAALVPLYLGVKAVIAKSFARIHKANLINAGILPLTFKDKSDYDLLNLYDELDMRGNAVYFKNKPIYVIVEASQTEKDILEAGGKINWIKRSYA